MSELRMTREMSRQALEYRKDELAEIESACSFGITEARRQVAALEARLLEVHKEQAKVDALLSLLKEEGNE